MVLISVTGEENMFTNLWLTAGSLRVFLSVHISCLLTSFEQQTQDVSWLKTQSWTRWVFCTSSDSPSVINSLYVCSAQTLLMWDDKGQNQHVGSILLSKCMTQIYWKNRNSIIFAKLLKMVWVCMMLIISILRYFVESTQNISCWASAFHPYLPCLN